MIKNYFIWDKKSSINGCDALTILEDKYFNKYKVVFFTDENDIPCRHDFIELLRNNLKMHTETDVEVCQAKFDKIILEQNKQEMEQLSLEDAHDKISILTEKLESVTVENTTLQESQKMQDRIIIESEMKMMDMEFVLEDLVTGINPAMKINLMEVFNMKERSAVYFNQLKNMINDENYDSKEDMERILNKFASGSRARITKEEYNILFDMLYPPIYDIPTQLPEIKE